MGRRLLVSLLVVVLLVSFAAPVMAQEGKDEVITLRLLSGAVGQELELTKAQAERYMAANPNVKVEVFDTPDAVQDRLGVYLQYFETKSTEADLYQIDVIWPGDLAEHLIDFYEYPGAK